MWIRETQRTYKDQHHIQLPVVLLHELLIVFLGLFAVVFVELSPTILFGVKILAEFRRGRGLLSLVRCVLFPTAWVS